MVVDRYKGHSVYKLRETFYRVLDGRETFEVFDEKTGHKAFTFVGFYNPKAILRPENKEAAITEIMAPVFQAIRAKIDSGDLTDGFLHVGRPTPVNPSAAPLDSVI